jgi:hypothetical protein
VNDLFAKTKSVLVNPRLFYQNLKENTYKPALVYYSLWTLIRLLISFIITFFISKQTNSPFIVPILIIGYFLALGVSFISALFLHAWIKLFKGKGTYTQTYQLYIYSDTANLILGFLPIVSFIAKLYGLYMLIIGTQVVHGINKRTAIIMYLVPIAIILAISILALVGVLTIFRPFVNTNLLNGLS